MRQIGDRRPLNRLERSLGYGLLGWAAEVAFSGVRDLTDPGTRSWRLQGHSYLWMLPIYGLLAFLFEPLHDQLRTRPLLLRAAAYATGVSAVEYATGMSLRPTVGLVPWDYTGHSPWVLPGGAPQLQSSPGFAAA